MAENENNPLGNYETTEHKMSGDNEVGGGGSSGTGGHPKQVFTVAGKETSTGKMIGGFVVLVICEVIAVASKVDDEYGLVSFIAVLGGLIGAFAIWRHKDK